MLVFIPLAPAELAAWARGEPRSGDGFAATPAFLSGFGLGAADDPDADLTLLEIAALDALLRHGVRLVAVAEAAATPAEPADLGAVGIDRVGWRRVTSLFADDPHGAALAASVKAALGGTTLAAAWDAEATRPLLSDAELLWHDASEWERLSH